MKPWIVINIRSTQWRREISTPNDIARPQKPHLPRLIVGYRLILRDGGRMAQPAHGPTAYNA
ncbi:MAG: hypothetical protein R3D03_21500 [Geminicoccaceae bacterium]